MTWTTQFGEPVGIGDEVALSLYGHPDARAQVVGVASEGNLIVDCGHCDVEIAVQELNLAAVLRVGSGPVDEVESRRGVCDRV